MPRDTMLLPIGDVARLCGLTLRALRFYEEKGLITPVRQGRRRLYDAPTVERLAAIARFRAAGLSLSDVRAILNAPPAETAARAHTIAEKRIAVLDKQRAALSVILWDCQRAMTTPREFRDVG